MTVNLARIIKGIHLPKIGFGQSRLICANVLGADNLLQIVFEEIDICGWEWYVHEGRTNISGRIREVLGGLPEKINERIGYLEHHIFTDDLAKVIDRRNSLFFSENESYSVEYRLRTISGKTVWLKEHGRVADRDDLGRITKVLGLISNITKTKKVEQQLHRFEKTIESADITVVITDKAGMIEYANPFFSALTGYVPSDYLGKNINFQKSGFHSSEFYKNLWQTISSGSVWDSNFYNRKKNGEFYWEHAIITPIKDEHSEITHFVAIKRDITEQKRLEAMLKKHEKQLQLAMRVAKMGYWKMDIETFSVEWSEGHDILFGIPLGEFEGSLEAVQKCVHPDDRDLGIINLKRAMERNEPFNNTYRVVHPNGEIRWLYSHGLFFNDSEGHPDHLFGITQDITDQKLAEMELVEAKARAEESNQLKTAFLNNISHEFNTPLNGILGFSELLLISDGEAEQKKEYGKQLRDSCNRLVATVEDTVELSLIHTNSLSITNSVCVLGDIVNELVNSASELADLKGLDFRSITSATCGRLEVVIDHEKFKKALMHLLSNAIKYTHKGFVEFQCKLSYKNILIKITDTGIGVSEEHQDKIFNPYFQMEKGYTRSFQGSGIGLSLAKAYIKMLDGSIELKSELKRGTRVTVKIPIVKP